MFADMRPTEPERLEALRVAFLPWIQARLESGDYLGWLAETPEKQVVAGAGLWLIDWPLDPQTLNPRRPYILNVYVEREHRRRGLARRVVQAAVDYCREAGYQRVILHASEEGRLLYETMGFVATREMRLDL
jgi:GNAT superfamily N-acetyltransferase